MKIPSFENEAREVGSAAIPYIKKAYMTGYESGFHEGKVEGMHQVHELIENLAVEVGEDLANMPGEKP